MALRKQLAAIGFAMGMVDAYQLIGNLPVPDDATRLATTKLKDQVKEEEMRRNCRLNSKECMEQSPSNQSPSVLYTSSQQPVSFGVFYLVPHNYPSHFY